MPNRRNLAAPRKTAIQRCQPFRTLTLGLPLASSTGMTTKTKHSEACTRVFSRLDPACPRCQELSKGAPARRGWSRSNPAAAEISDIHDHFTSIAHTHCGPVCTYGDW